ncbi:hypothetical protein IWW46_003010, partial [Coemansia sp. RSA 2440]
TFVFTDVVHASNTYLDILQCQQKYLESATTDNIRIWTVLRALRGVRLIVGRLYPTYAVQANA